MGGFGGLVGRGGRLLVVSGMVVRVRCLGVGRVEGCEARGGSEGGWGKGKGMRCEWVAGWIGGIAREGIPSVKNSI